MNKWTKVARWICIVCVFGAAGNLFAQEDHFIENQRYVVGINDFSWGDTYVGKTTSSNGLLLAEQIDGTETNSVKLTINSLQIGSETNSGNIVRIDKGGELTIAGDFTVLGTNNLNGLIINDQGTLFMQSDFDAAMGGFYYTNGARLKVGGEISNLDNVENGLNFTLTGDEATWNFGTNILTIGALTDANSVSISNNALLEIDNISIGSSGTVSNGFVVSDNGRVFVHDSISIDPLGDNYLYVTNAGILAVDFDFDASLGIVDIQQGGILEAHQNLIYHGITNGGGIIMTGTNANWSNLSGSSLIVGTTNDNSLIIRDGATVRAGNIIIGDSNTQSNNVYVTSGGNLILENTGSMVASRTNGLWITQGGKLTLESNYDYALNSGLRWGNGGIIEAFAEAPVFNGRLVNGEYVENGGLFLQDGQTLILNGPSARWSGVLYNLHIGDLSSDNALIVTNGGVAFANSVSVGDFKEGGNNNQIIITGTDSRLLSGSYIAIGGTMDSGYWYEGGTNNVITVDNGGVLFATTTLHNRNTTGTSGLEIKPGGVVLVKDYYQANGAYLNIYTDTSGTNAGLLRVVNTAEFEAGAKVGFDAIADLVISKVYTNRIVESSTLIVGGVTNATTADLNSLENAGGALVNYDLWETNQNIYATFTRRSISEGGGIDPDSMLDLIAKEIDRLASEGNAAASNQVEILSNMGSDLERKLQMEQMYSYGIPSYMHNQGVFGGIDQVRARGAAFHGKPDNSTLPRPKGVAGPHTEDQGLQGWAKVYGSFGNRDSDDDSGFEDGYNAQTYGTVFGLDQAFGSWLFGLAGGYAGSILDGDNGDESDASTGYGILYANYGTKEWFGDLVLSYGLTDMDNTSGTDFDVTSNTKASQSTVYIGGGYQFEDKPSGALLRPLFGIQVNWFDQDAYTESSNNSLAKDVEAYDRLGAQSTLGASVVFPKAGETVDMELQLRSFWLHEFNGDEEKVGYTLIDSGQLGQFLLRSPDQDIAQLGMGFVSNWKTGWQLRADIDLQLGKTYTATTLSGSLLYEF